MTETYILPFDRITAKDHDRVGGKCQNTVATILTRRGDTRKAGVPSSRSAASSSSLREDSPFSRQTKSPVRWDR